MKSIILGNKFDEGEVIKGGFRQRKRNLRSKYPAVGGKIY
jgi:hypothetical protein